MFNTNIPNKDDLPTTTQLLRSTGIALVIAVGALFGVVLPAEYGIDPTGAGKLLGLTQMGEIKQQLAEEAAEDVERLVLDPYAPTAVTAVAEAVAARPAAGAAEKAPVWTDEVSVTLAPDEAAEVKLVMTQGAAVEYDWTVEGGGLNYELHADFPGGDGFHSYKKARNVTGDKGEFTAGFEGAHGWYWRNRSGKEVTVTLRVRGDYSEVKRMM